MREHGVFVPSGDRVIGAVVALPDREARGVVVLTTGGGGALRSHYFALWTRVARELADRGIASIRMEHAGVGDSTGEARMNFRALPVDDVEAVARFGLEVTGTRRLGLCGNCGGARAALEAARSLHESQTLLLLWLRHHSSTRRTTGRYRIAGWIARRLPRTLKQVAKRAYWRSQSNKEQGGPLADALREVAATSHLMLIEKDDTLAVAQPPIVSELRAAATEHRLEMLGVDGLSMQAFHDLDRQRQLLEIIVSWFDETFPPASVRQGEAAASVTPSA